MDNPASALGQAPAALSSSSSSGRSGSITPSVPHREMSFTPPIMQGRWHVEPVSDILFSDSALITACQGGQAKVWARPGRANGSAGGAREGGTSSG